jgi:hypothetical protein
LEFYSRKISLNNWSQCFSNIDPISMLASFLFLPKGISDSTKFGGFPLQRTRRKLRAESSFS